MPKPLDEALAINVTVICATPESALRAQEAVGRLIVGLALEGLWVQSNMSAVDMRDYVDEDRT